MQRPAGKFHPETLHLLPPMKFNELTRHWPFRVSNECPQIACPQRQSPQHERLPGHLVGGSEQLPNRMVPHGVIHHAGRKVSLHRTTLCSPHLTMVLANLLGKGARLPAFHPGGNYRDTVDCADLYGKIAADRFITLAPEHLASAGYMIEARELVIETLALSFNVRCSHHSKHWVHC